MLFHRLFQYVLLCLILVPVGIEGQPHLKITTTDISCYGKKDGAIHIESNSSLPSDFQILVSDSSKELVHKFDSSSVFPIHIKELSCEKYFISLISQGLNENQTVTISSPEKLQLELIKIIKLDGKGESALVSLQAFPSGGTMPYNYQWSENTGLQQTAVATKLPLGIYNCKINDKNNCGPVEATFYLFEDEIASYEKANITK